MRSDKLTSVPSPEEGLRAALTYLDESWPRTFDIMKSHNPNNPNKYYDIVADISASPVLQKSIDEMSEAYRKVMIEKGRIKLQAAELDKQKPGFIKRTWSKEARGKAVELTKAKEPLEKEFSDWQWELWQMNTAYFERLRTEVAASYDDATRKKLGEKVDEQASIDAYIILGKMIQYTVERFNEAFVRYGVDEFGVPKNIADPRPGRE